MNLSIYPATIDAHVGILHTHMHVHAKKNPIIVN